ncbi:four helix bundle protein [Aquimarina agarivorans]|uniref:four helix bundle protein n=1 Tax=Aquimarina agarivorans TaxID=980584 RepID=UPI000248E8C9|nr:four helix bundle protein [Aquimarina agarivorans]
MERGNIVVDKSFEFALKIIELYRILNIEKEFIISKQLLRSGTSIGANIQEATAGFSKKDFIYKMSIASKEARETKYWLQLLNKSNITNTNVDTHLNEVNHLISILTKIVKTSQQNL